MNPFLRSALGFLLRPFHFAILWLSGFVPRDPDTWAFGTWNGVRFADNAAAVFRHLKDHPEPGVRTVWITRRRDIRNDLRDDRLRAYTAWSPGGIWWGLRSGVYVYDSTPRDLNFWLSRGAKLVLLRHGIGMKKIERAIDTKDHRLYKLFHGRPAERTFWRIALPWHVPVPDLVSACSPTHAEQAVSYFGVDLEQVEITGFPRHDRLEQVGPATRVDIPTVGAAVPDDRPVFLYLPTFREGRRRQTFQWSALQQAAVGANVTIAVKLHPVDAHRGVRNLEAVGAASHLRLVEPTVDPVDVYPFADGLITDFSSVAYDHLLLDRPVIHFVPDLDGFIAQRPLLGALEDLAVGPICQNGADLSAALVDATGPDGNTMAERRREMRERFYTYAPGRAAERVVAAVRELVSSRVSTSRVPSTGDRREA